jgi:hypothetical protein
MSGHVYVVISGFQRRIIPSAAPYRVTRDRERIRLDVELAGSWRSAVYEPAEETSDDVADVVAGPDWNDWWLETTRYEFRRISPVVITAQAETSSLARTMECHARIATDIRAGSE